MTLTADWRDEIMGRWGIRILSNYDALLINQALWVTRCSKTKNDIARGTPKQLYVSPVNKYFYQQMESHNLRYGVLSDKYGLHLDNEKLSYYDVHPRELDHEDKMQLGEFIRRKAESSGFFQIVYYSPSPLMSIPYFQMLELSGLDSFYTTRLNFAQVIHPNELCQ